ncbi:P-loop containing nucleoside triphosphate hydrolase protein [Cokeromyces recurvatus]|uniref:P-loop containing nucleoside triphosphate hydrolase protein n=1 Tax=Cokeromyces recurvatus TaxID=90255 RepID=UPI0022209332|nr:P-loop containing nucleoside triphosphate hydrolase protein [Cokeromyces recurvatus]KAI7907348.1 P-loop containing nucleoside triphosphate hydrolase protein [Cokeromyces recurvatus]
MDYLAAERERGITINSAAITFGWQGHRINLIDTPGHVDFTMEVERAVRVLDGAVTILDGVAGVEAQTETVWKQANRHDIPRIAFINKMDRVGAAFGRTVREMWKKLRTRPLVIQLPVINENDSHDHQKGLCSMIDLVSMELIQWDPAHQDGSVFTRSPLDKVDLEIDKKWVEEAVKGRTALIEALAEMDDTIVEVFLDEAEGDHMRVKADAIKSAIRRVTISNKAVPVLCGASFKNLGVQPLLNAIIDYLPSPLDRPSALVTYNNGKTALVPLNDNHLCALAFKVIHDSKKGPLVFVKVYSGKLNTRMSLFNTTTKGKERVNKLLQMYAKDVEEIPSISAGNIGVIVGLKDTRTGDTLVQSNNTNAIKNGLQLGNIEIPNPAFFAAVEPASISEETALQNALTNLVREDPSIQFWTDEESGQMLVSGMGELHLEIVKDRLINDFKVKVEMGKMRISYRETCQNETDVKAEYDRELLGKRARAACRIEVSPIHEALDTDNEKMILEDGWISNSGNYLKADVTLAEDGGSLETGSDTLTSSKTHLQPEEVTEAVHNGLLAGLSRGAILGFPLTKIKVKAYDLKTFGQETTLGAISACVSNGIFEAIKNASPCLLEPMMEVYTEVNENHIGSIVSNLSGTRRGHVIGLESSIEDKESEQDKSTEDMQVYAPKDILLTNSDVDGYKPKQVIKAHVPLSSMLGYSNALRSLTGGSGSFSMRVIGYGEMSKDRERIVISEMKGY